MAQTPIAIVGTGCRFPGGIPTESAALRGYLLDRICVQAPYFALDDLRVAGEWLHARAELGRAPDVEVGAIGIAEAARHLAILGSCAVRLQSRQSGRIYNPVRSTTLVEISMTTKPLTEVWMRARCVHVDPLRAEATAVAELLGPGGERIACFEIGYHVIPEAQFHTLFAAHARPTDEANGDDPYVEVQPAPTARQDGEGLVAELGPIDARRCLGHFLGYPAYPVSIMARDAVQLVAEAVRRREAVADLRVRVVGGTAGAARFVFAGASMTVTARPDPDRAVRGTADQRWRVEVRTNGELAAWFDMELILVEDTPIHAWLRALDRAMDDPRPRTRPTRNREHDAGVLVTDEF